MNLESKLTLFLIQSDLRCLVQTVSFLLVSKAIVHCCRAFTNCLDVGELEETRCVDRALWSSALSRIFSDDWLANAAVIYRTSARLCSLEWLSWSCSSLLMLSLPWRREATRYEPSKVPNANRFKLFLVYLEELFSAHQFASCVFQFEM